MDRMRAYSFPLCIVLSALLSWAAIYTGLWPLVIIAGIAAGTVTGVRYMLAFAGGFAGGIVSAFIWLTPLLTPGAAKYVADVGAIASIPGSLLVFLSFIITALYAAFGCVIGSWVRHYAIRNRLTSA